jgi:hypothetical protein
LAIVASLAFATWLPNSQAEAQQVPLGRGGAPRTAQPVFGPEIEQIFWTDAREQLGGGGLETGTSTPAPITPKPPPQVAGPGMTPEPPPTFLGNPIPSGSPGGGVAGGLLPLDLPLPRAENEWGPLIPGPVLEDEIKRLIGEARTETVAPGRFKSRGYRTVQRDFAMLAALFAVVADYQGDIRWKDQAAALRDRCAKAAEACAEGTDASFQTASNQVAMLVDLLNATRLTLPDAPSDRPWAEVIDTGQIMKRLGTAANQRLQPWSANDADLAANQYDALLEASVLATLGHILKDPSYLDDANWKKFSDELETAGKQAATAAQQGDAVSFKQHVAAALKSCENCHAEFR